MSPAAGCGKIQPGRWNGAFNARRLAGMAFKSSNDERPFAPNDGPAVTPLIFLIPNGSPPVPLPCRNDKSSRNAVLTTCSTLGFVAASRKSRNDTGASVVASHRQSPHRFAQMCQLRPVRAIPAASPRLKFRREPIQTTR
jgi:hypothetical protein